MRSTNAKRAALLWLMLAVMLSVGLATPSSTAQAQTRDYHDRWDRTRMSRYAFAMGYNRGYEDASEHSYRSYRDVQRWREGTEGWQDPMGSRNSFRDNFRRGFSQGFMDARRGRSRRYTQRDIDRWTSERNRG